MTDDEKNEFDEMYSLLKCDLMYIGFHFAELSKDVDDCINELKNIKEIVDKLREDKQ